MCEKKEWNNGILMGFIIRIICVFFLFGPENYEIYSKCIFIRRFLFVVDFMLR